MIKNILFDLGNVLIPLDEQRCIDRLAELYGFDTIESIPKHIDDMISSYELGNVSTTTFLDFMVRESKVNTTKNEVIDAWNSMLMGIYPGVIKMLGELKGNYQLFILSNTNELHIEWVDKLLLKTLKFPGFYKHFTHIYLSHEIHLSKPNLEIFSHVCEHARIRPYETIFFDDRIENIKAAESVGFLTAHVQSDDKIDELVKQIGLG